MNPTATVILLLSLATGTTITLMSHHWLLAWIGLEINTLAIIPFMTQTPHPRAIEAATKYFLTQATASALILFSATMNAWKTGEWGITLLLEPFTLTLTLALMMKLGLAPLHFWMPEVIQGIPLMTGLILSTWQKIAPLALIFQIHNLINNNLIVIIGITSILVGGWGGINQTQLRKIMAFSSIGHLGWMLIILKFNPTLTLFNFIFYILMTAAVFLSLSTLSATKMTNIFTSWPKAPALATTIMLALLSLAGLPPLSGFAPKLLIILELVKQDAMLISALILAASLLALFFYIRLTYILILTIPPNTSNSPTTWRMFYTPLHTTIMNVLALSIFSMTPTLLSII
uniref:NADH-ubiquinone oxidoreductase chain 2 n=2 Tax=Hoplobatrachus TaxID=110071 RepID=K7N7S8_HOPRU|nr:NADH dehydrogenase subunit 2 [Hoplobatrachus rugulosus]YP_009633269.1 NADH dehydrogenase subunit 2 [Hoplobatrachus chinensis x Hoplobatrachus rugulosus]ADG37207.1 NADH dehydrogenase subunit 2 [Hoplobatrachus rugulosus]AGE11470.1 NADH dehydrogenase subunit 2 [Hoplobatrachus rugulosus]QBS54604.1 NADH dehydrogenase subunit 2 [Hoplobatrachus chinensis x Hoplobatrachus rugulosus]